MVRWMAFQSMSFANNIHTHEGGTHEQGFRTALTRVINDYARQNKHSRIHSADKILRSCKKRMGIDGNIL